MHQTIPLQQTEPVAVVRYNLIVFFLRNRRGFETLKLKPR